MKSLASIAAAALAAVVCLTLPAVPASSPAPSGPKIAFADVEGTWLYLESPWGYFEWYWVDPGRNDLECAGTGNIWVYNHE